MLLGHELAAITAGVDRLYRTTPRGDGFLNKEGLIPVAVANVEPLSLRSYAEAAQALHDLALRLPGEAESELRRAYLAEMINSLLALVTTFEEKEISFAERLRRQLRVDTQMVPQSVLDGYVRTIREKLDELGYVGSSLAEDLGRWEEDNRVSPDGVLQVLRGYGEEARSRTSALMYDMQQEWLEPVAVQSVPFSAYCDYPARRLLLNLDFPYTRYALKHLACHEAFPGHLVHLALRQRYVAEGRMPLDGAQVVTSSASSALFEGIADNGLFFLDWVDTPDDELAVTLQRLRSALRCNAAWMLHHMNKTLDEIVPVIAEAGFQTEATVRGRLSFLNHGLRAPFVYAYWCGETAVYDVWKSVERERRPEFWHYLYANMHTPETLRTFWKS